MHLQAKRNRPASQRSTCSKFARDGNTPELVSMVFHGIMVASLVFSSGSSKNASRKRQANEPMEPMEPAGKLIRKHRPDALGATQHVTGYRLSPDWPDPFDWLSLVDSGQPVASSSEKTMASNPHHFLEVPWCVALCAQSDPNFAICAPAIWVYLHPSEQLSSHLGSCQSAHVQKLVDGSIEMQHRQRTQTFCSQQTHQMLRLGDTSSTRGINITIPNNFWMNIHLLVLNAGNGWEWGLLGWLLLVMTGIIAENSLRLAPVSSFTSHFDLRGPAASRTAIHSATLGAGTYTQQRRGPLRQRFHLWPWLSIETGDDDTTTSETSIWHQTGERIAPPSLSGYALMVIQTSSCKPGVDPFCLPSPNGNFKTLKWRYCTIQGHILWVFPCIGLYTHIEIYIYTHIWIHLYIYTYVCIHIYMYTYIRIDLM